MKLQSDDKCNDGTSGQDKSQISYCTVYRAAIFIERARAPFVGKLHSVPINKLRTEIEHRLFESIFKMLKLFGIFFCFVFLSLDSICNASCGVDLPIQNLPLECMCTYGTYQLCVKYLLSHLIYIDHHLHVKCSPYFEKNVSIKIFVDVGYLKDMAHFCIFAHS